MLDERRGGTAGDGHGQRQTLTFVAGRPLPNVRCVAAGGFPPPSVNVFLDERDVTDRFDVVQRSSLHGVHGLQVAPLYSTYITSFTLTPSRRIVTADAMSALRNG